MKLVLPGALVLASCWTASHPDPHARAGAVEVEVASVSLADDCPDPEVEAVAPAGPSSSQHSSASMACAKGYDCGGTVHARSSCEQTTLQLRVKATDGGGTIRIKRVELIDRGGNRVGTLDARAPSRWTDGGYVPWNEAIASHQHVTASYALSAPDWDELPGGRDATVPYRVRVTIAIGDEERTLDKPATVSVDAPAVAEPHVVT